jgi:hypothetical protein
MATTIFKGVVHGKTIELDREPELPDGQEVTVMVQPLIGHLRFPTSPEALESLKQAAGGWAEDAEELDKFLEWNRQQRKSSRREIPE